MARCRTLIRERTGNRRSLDDFARRFFSATTRGDWQPRTYTFEDIVATLNAVMPYDWDTFLRERIEAQGTEPPLDGVTRGGYRLVFRSQRSEYQRTAESRNRNADFTYSIGVGLGSDGNITSVQWDGPAFNEGLAVGSQIVAVNGVSYSADGMRRAIEAAADGATPIELLVKSGDQYRAITLNYHDGLRYPHLERIRGASDRLGAILTPRRN
ncbi:MAG: hypothetical protein R3C16_10055 [Hyphomonadaceae bacterium]